MDLDHRHVDDLESVPNRVAVVRPGARVDDDAFCPASHVVAPLDVLALVVRLEAPDGETELLRPTVDTGFEVAEPDAAVESRVSLAEHV